ncbi:MAG: hypothetical protein L3J83_02140, partial [Proteobacteria bacterium]|nr:hypothetical protein [Pseudomonadota bacterium]
SGQKVIDKIASAMRHIEPEDYNVELSNGVKIKGHEMKITKKINVKYLSTGLVDERDLYCILRDYLNEILDNN